MPLLQFFFAIIIVATIIGVAVGRYPWLRMNRATIALTGAAILLISRRIEPEAVFREIDLSLLVFFSGLFIVTGAIESVGHSRSGLSAVREPARWSNSCRILGLVPRRRTGTSRSGAQLLHNVLPQTRVTIALSSRL